MKQQVAISLAGLMLLTAGYENGDGMLAAFQKKKPEKATPQDVRERNIHDQWEGKNNPGLYEGGFFVRADFLYWRADEGGLEYGAVSQITDNGASSKLKSPHIKWDPGFRVGVGYTFSSHDYWDLSGIWTHFQTKQTASETIDISNSTNNRPVFIPGWSTTALGDSVSDPSVVWDLKYNIYDLDLGRNYFVSRKLSVHPFIGVRGATIDQHYHAKYDALVNTPLFSSIRTSFKATTDFWGIGAHIGSAFQWYFTSAFSVVGNIGGSLLYGNFKIKERYQGLRVENQMVVGTIPVATSQDISTGSFNIETLLGFRWEQFFYNNRYRLSITAGYEWSEWFSQNRLIKVDVFNTTSNTGSSISVQNNGNLTLQGANLQVRWDF